MNGVRSTRISAQLSDIAVARDGRRRKRHESVVGGWEGNRMMQVRSRWLESLEKKRRFHSLVPSVNEEETVMTVQHRVSRINNEDERWLSDAWLFTLQMSFPESNPCRAFSPAESGLASGPSLRSALNNPHQSSIIDFSEIQPIDNHHAAHCP